MVDADNQVIGIFTEADALRSGITSGRLGTGTKVRSAMTTPVQVVSLQTDVAEIARRVLGDRLRSVPVVDDGVLVGIVSRRDMLGPLVRHDDSIASRMHALLTDYAGRRGRST
jgi:CBS domain-containing protein